MPAATSTLEAATDMANGMFNEYAITVIGLVLGLAVAGLFIKFITRNVKGFLKSVFGGGKKRGGRY